MNKYFVYDNAGRRIRVGSEAFVFEVVGNVGGAWRGVLVESESKRIEALLTVATQLGIREITKEEYDEEIKKKTSLTPSSPPQLILTPNSKEDKDRAAAVVVGGVVTPQTKAEHERSNVTATIEEVLKVGKAPYVDPLEQRKVKTNRRKKLE